MFALAAALDTARSEAHSGSSVAANARALHVLAKEFRERVGVVLPPADVAANTAQSNVDSADEVARKRAARRGHREATG